MHAVLDLKSSPWQPAERLDPLKNGMKFRIAKKTTVILKSFAIQDLDACHGLIN